MKAESHTLRFWGSTQALFGGSADPLGTRSRPRERRGEPVVFPAGLLTPRQAWPEASTSTTCLLCSTLTSPPALRPTSTVLAGRGWVWRAGHQDCGPPQDAGQKYEPGRLLAEQRVPTTQA